MSNPPVSAVKSAMRTLDVIEYVLARKAGVAAQEISDALDIPGSSLSYLLSTLVERGYLSRDRRSYFAGPSLDRFADRDSTASLEANAATLLRNLRNDCNETCSFMVLEGWEIEARVTEASGHGLRFAIEIGSRKPLHSMAAGKAILAALPDARLTRYFAETNRAKFTGTTLVNESDIRAEIARIRTRGFAQASEEDQVGVIGFACAIEYGVQCFGAVAIAMPTVRYRDEVRDMVVTNLMRAARQLSPK